MNQDALSQNALNPLRNRDAMAYYLGHLSASPSLLVGRLLLNSKYLAFHICEIHQGGLFQPPRLTASGRVLAVPLEKVMDISVEKGVRSKRSRPNWRDKRDFDRKASGERKINIPPGPLESSERFQQMMITTESDAGVEVAVFEVENPEAWAQALKAQLGRIRS